jgi:hypothetical protein
MLNIVKGGQMNRTRGNKGSTLLLVLAMLSILFLIGAALSFSTRLEGQASANYAELTQARMSAATGLPAAAPMIAAASNGLTSTLQPWYTAPSQWNLAAQGRQNAASSSAGSSRSGSSAQSRRAGSQGTGSGNDLQPQGGIKSNAQAIFTISDMSSRVNLNTVRGEEPLARVLNGVLPGSATDVRSKARELIRLRGGDKVSSSASRLDLRRVSASPQTRLENLSAVRTKKGKQSQPLFTEDEIRTLNSYLTVFSESPEVFNTDNGTTVPKLPLHDLAAGSVYETLKKAFPKKDDALLQQFAANVVDFADPDDAPTLMNAAAQATQPWRVIFGSEQTPLITEIYPDATSPVTEGDHGQFVEISNPWAKPMVMTNWRLVISGGGTIIINQTLPPTGTLIITDNYDQPAEKSRPGTGSFLSIFGARKDDMLHKLQAESGMVLPDRDSYVALYNGAGQLIDAFAYGSPGQLDSRMSFQREDPRLRSARTADANPFEQAASGGTSQMQATRLAWARGNQPLKSAADLFNISTAYVSTTTGSAMSAAQSGSTAAAASGHPWQLPALTASNDAPSATNLDLRLVDVFTNWEREAAPTTATLENGKSKNGRQMARMAGASFARAGARTAAAQGVQNNNSAPAITSNSLAYSYGKLNLNTCAKVALLGLDVKINGAAWPAADTLEKFETYRLRKLQEKKAPFTNVSDFLAEFFPHLTASDLPAIADLLDQVTVGSSAFEVVAQNRLAPEDSAPAKAGSKTPERLTRKPAIAKARWVLSTDQQPYSLIQFTTVP